MEGHRETIEEYLARGGKITREEDFVRVQDATRKGVRGQNLKHTHHWRKVEPGRFRCDDCGAYGHRIDLKNWQDTSVHIRIFEERCFEKGCKGWGTDLRDVGMRRLQPFCPKH